MTYYESWVNLNEKYFFSLNLRKSFINNETTKEYSITKQISLKEIIENPGIPIREISITIIILIPIAIIKKLLGRDDQKCLGSLMLNNEKYPTSIINRKTKVCNFWICAEKLNRRFPKNKKVKPSRMIKLPKINPRIVSWMILLVSGLVGYLTWSVAIDRVT